LGLFKHLFQLKKPFLPSTSQAPLLTPSLQYLLAILDERTRTRKTVICQLLLLSTLDARPTAFTTIITIANCAETSLQRRKISGE
jgi:hypothetical protein